MKNNRYKKFAGAVLLVALGYLIGAFHLNVSVQAERELVLSAVARTMRCSSVEEFDQGMDHQCEPWEIAQDAGLAEVK